MSAADGSEPPTRNSYWMMPGRLAAGEYPGAPDPAQAAIDVRTLLEAGVDHFIDLTEESDGLEPYARIAHDEARRLGKAVQWERHPIADMSVPRSPDEMVNILDAIDDALNSGRTVYVHCLGGVGRTGTAIGCWLVRHGLTGDEALAQIAEWWKRVEKASLHPDSPETPRQREYARAWHEPPRDPTFSH